MLPPCPLLRLPSAAKLLGTGAVHVGDAAAPAAVGVVLLWVDRHQAADPAETQAGFLGWVS